MQKLPRVLLNHLLLAGLCTLLIAATSAAQTSIRQVKVLDAKDAVEIEVQASERLVPKTQVLTGPDRLVVDFPNAIPGAQLRAVSVGRGEVKDVRVGLQESNPPMTRLVLDLKTAQSFQVFPYGRTLIIKVSNQTTTAKVSNAPRTIDEFEDFPEQPTRPGLMVANYSAGTERVRIETPTKPLEVLFRDGLLTIKANKANLSEILFAVQLRTGAEVAIASGAEQEQVVGEIGPAPAPEVLARLLNGSKFNYLVVSAANDPRQLERVILTPRGEAPVTPPQSHPEDDADDDVAPPPPPVRTAPPHFPQPIVPAQVQMQMPPQATVPGPQAGSETKPATDDNTPDQ